MGKTVHNVGGLACEARNQAIPTHQIPPPPRFTPPAENTQAEVGRMDSGVLQVARGGSGAEAPPLAARPSARRRDLDIEQST